MKLLVVSICRNEQATIKKLIARIPRRIKGVTHIEIAVIDDGSTDKTVVFARRAGATVYSDNSSKGLAFRFREAIDIALETGADLMVNIDGDLQFNPKDIPRLVAPIIANEADFVAADRFTNPRTGKREKPANMPLVKYYGNKVGAWVVGSLSKERFRDVTCGFRAYSERALYALNTNGDHTYTQESFQLLAARRMRIKSLPVEVTYFKDRKSRVVTSIPKYILISMTNILRAFRDFAPLRFFILLGLLPLILGLACLVFVGIHWLRTDMLSPYKAVGFIGIYLVSLAIFLWSLGLIADMQVRLLNNQEKVYEALRRLSHKKSK